MSAEDLETISLNYRELLLQFDFPHEETRNKVKK